jgi:hypothetical protein
LYLLLVIIVVELAIIILAWPEAREIAYWVAGLVVVGTLIVAGAYFNPLAQLWSIIPSRESINATLSWQNVENALAFAVVIAVGGAGAVICADGARGWVGERLISTRTPDQPLWHLLMSAALLVLFFSSLFLIGGLDPTSLLDREERLAWVIGGAIVDFLVLAWVVIGLRRLKRHGQEFYTLKFIRWLARAEKKRGEAGTA